MKKRFVTIILVALALTGCIQKQPNSDSNKQTVDSVTQQKPSIDSLLNTIVRPSQMELPMVWTDTIYDTCFTNWSHDRKYAVFVGRTEEDKILGDQHLTCYGILSMDERNSIFLYDAGENAISLLMTTSPEGFGLYLPKIDMKRDWVYYFREYGATTMSFMRYNLKTKEEEFLTGCYYQVLFDVKPNGNILFQNVREDVLVIDTSLLEDEIGWLGYVFCDIEMTPEGICVNKSKYYNFDDMDTKTGKSFDVSEMIILNNEQYSPRWEPSEIGDFNEFYDKKGNHVGTTYNTIESYDGWNGQKQTKK